MLCQFCRIFTEYMLDGNLGDIDCWRPYEGPDYELSIASKARPQISETGEYSRPCCFTHYSRYYELEESATAGCQLCALIRNCSGPLEEKSHRDRRSNAPVRLVLSTITDGDVYKRFRVSTGKMTALQDNLLQIEYYKRCETFPTLNRLLDLNLYEGYEISQSASSESCMQLALRWLDECSRFHKKRCGPTSSSLPTRVLDLGRSDELSDGDTIRLIVTNGQKASYTALSHCWGPPEDAARVKVTSTKTLAAHSAGIHVEELSRNFQDAIIVTRKLNIRYLWIDSLCIIQDSPSNWEEEAGKMGDYYERATITLSALCSSSSRTGFLSRRWLDNSRVDFRLENYKNINIRKVNRPFGLRAPDMLPLWKRGWVVQERCLSSRILHFGSEQMYWECRQSFVHEDGCRLSMSPDSALMGPGCFIPTGERLVEKSYGRWYALIAAYSKRSLTREADRLPALGGIVLRFQEIIKSEYLAGIWKGDIIRGLLWCRKNSIRRSKSSRKKKALTQQMEIVSSQPELNSPYKVPSWSWAGIESPVVWSSSPEIVTGQLSAACEVIEARVTSLGPVHLGRVSEGSLQLLGFLAQSSLKIVTTYNGAKGYLTKFENICASMDYRGADVTHGYFLYVANDTKTYSWLTLAQCTPDDRLYRRMGILYANKVAHGLLLKDAEQATVTIV